MCFDEMFNLLPFKTFKHHKIAAKFANDTDFFA